jgi:taurine--2-oxoglutarate transaminase
LQEKPSSIAAILMEPVVGSDALIVYPDGYLLGVRALTEKYGILLIFDEVMTGFGRVGEAFASIRVGVRPDLITFAKASSASYIPLGGVMVREDLASVFDDRLFDCGQTHAGHPVAMAAGLGALKAYKKDGLFQQGRKIELWLKSSFQTLAERHEIVGDYRGLGAFFGVEFVRDRKTREPVTPWQDVSGNGPMNFFYKETLKRGVWIHGKYSIYLISPPLTITEEDIAYGFSVIDDVLSDMPALTH